jgi:hypothetical protein
MLDRNTNPREELYIVSDKNIYLLDDYDKSWCRYKNNFILWLNSVRVYKNSTLINLRLLISFYHGLFWNKHQTFYYKTFACPKQ